MNKIVSGIKKLAVRGLNVAPLVSVIGGAIGIATGLVAAPVAMGVVGVVAMVTVTVDVMKQTNLKNMILFCSASALVQFGSFAILGNVVSLLIMSALLPFVAMVLLGTAIMTVEKVFTMVGKSAVLEASCIEA